MKHIVSILFITLLLTGCSKDEKEVIRTDFEGNNHIVSFIVTAADGTAYHADIADDKIVLEVPEGANLQEATAKYTISENGTLQPDPKTITDWTQQYRFLATSYSLKDRVYTYTVSYIESQIPQNVTLATQEEVNTFGKSGVEVVTGNLTIGRSSSIEPITDLSALSKLKIVRGELIFQQSFKGELLDGLSSLEYVGGLSISQSKLDEQPKATLVDIYLPSLKTVNGDFRAESAILENVNLPELTTISGNLVVRSAKLIYFKAEKLAFVKDIRLSGSDYSGFNLIKSPLRELALPTLKKCNELFLEEWYLLKLVDLPELTELRTLNPYECGYVESLHVPKLERALSINLEGFYSDGTAFPGSYLPRMVEVSFPSLKYVAGEMRLPSGFDIVDVMYDFPALTAVEGRLIVGEKFSFPLLQEVGKNHVESDNDGYKTLYVSYNKNKNLAFPSLKKVYGSALLSTLLPNVEAVSLPELLSVEKTLYISRGVGGNGHFFNTSLTEILAPKLTSVGKLFISENSLLDDFSTFATLVPHLTPDQWEVTYCLYNPTYEDVVAGRYKP